MKTKPWGKAPPATRAAHALQQLSQDPNTVASQAIRDKAAWQFKQGMQVRDVARVVQALYGQPHIQRLPFCRIKTRMNCCGLACILGWHLLLGLAVKLAMVDHSPHIWLKHHRGLPSSLLALMMLGC
jgi:hypothetical protein